ncbi:MAG: hypothetical protein JWN49_359 [Parcubacteria group bacterium]|nr:hypothetical protein [Parcubacteria group bacterium]
MTMSFPFLYTKGAPERRAFCISRFAHTTLQALLLINKQVDESPEDSPSGPHQ